MLIQLPGGGYCMEFQDTQVIQMAGIIWKKEEGFITFTVNGHKYIFNRSLTNIIKKINGIRTVKDIVDDFAEEYKETIKYEDVKENVYYGLELLYKEGFININKKDDEYGGWYEYN